jgi:hypothetical protein
MIEPIDDLLAKIPDGWDFWIGSDWSKAGVEVYIVNLFQRANTEGEFYHPGHHLQEIETEGKTLREALTSALAKLP